MSSDRSHEYWARRAIPWERSAYGGKAGFVDSLARIFRGDGPRRRRDRALALLKPHVVGRRALEIGCGSGALAVALAEAGVAGVIGWDVSPEAIAAAQNLAQERKVDDRCRFEVHDLRATEIPDEIEICVGLGVIEYLTDDELREWFACVGERDFLFSFSRPPRLMRRILRAAYIAWTGCPGVFFRAENELLEIARETTGETPVQFDGSLMYFMSDKSFAK